MAAAVRASSPGRGGADKPLSPRLAPLGSPGPVTPLELEGEEGYMVAGAKREGGVGGEVELVESLIRDEARRRGRRGSAGGRRG